MKTFIEITVRSTGGTYMTNRVNKLQASNTSGPEHAARRLGEKLYGKSLTGVTEIATPYVINVSHWRLHAEEHYAWCWQTGEIEIGLERPVGALRFAVGMEAPLRELLEGIARHGYEPGLLLVPGVPEADGDEAKLDALIAWQTRNRAGNGQPERRGVVFLTGERRA